MIDIIAYNSVGYDILPAVNRRASHKRRGAELGDSQNVIFEGMPAVPHYYTIHAQKTGIQ